MLVCVKKLRFNSDGSLMKYQNEDWKKIAKKCIPTRLPKKGNWIFVPAMRFSSNFLRSAPAALLMLRNMEGTGEEKTFFSSPSLFWFLPFLSDEVHSSSYQYESFDLSYHIFFPQKRRLYNVMLLKTSSLFFSFFFLLFTYFLTS
jgi:hypothetical protein